MFCFCFCFILNILFPSVYIFTIHSSLDTLVYYKLRILSIMIETMHCNDNITNIILLIITLMYKLLYIYICNINIKNIKINIYTILTRDRQLLAFLKRKLLFCVRKTNFNKWMKVNQNTYFNTFKNVYSIYILIYYQNIFLNLCRICVHKFLYLKIACFD